MQLTRRISIRIFLIVLLNAFTVGYGLVKFAQAVIDCNSSSLRLNLAKDGNDPIEWRTSISCPLNVCIDSTMGVQGQGVEEALNEWNKAWKTACSGNGQTCPDGIFKKVTNCGPSGNRILIKKVNSLSGGDEFGQALRSPSTGKWIDFVEIQILYTVVDPAHGGSHEKTVRAVEHELGHALGLGDETQLTQPYDRMDAFGAGTSNVSPAWDSECSPQPNPERGISNRDGAWMTCTPTFKRMCQQPYTSCVEDF